MFCESLIPNVQTLAVVFYRAAAKKFPFWIVIELMKACCDCSAPKKAENGFIIYGGANTQKIENFQLLSAENYTQFLQEKKSEVPLQQM